MRLCLVFLALLAFVPPAAAQSTYVGASLVGDIARYSGVDYDDDEIVRILGDSSDNGEALGFNVKIGRAITERWGVEFEYARSGEFDGNAFQVFPAGIRELLPTLPGGSSLTIWNDFRVESERRHSSMSALAFVRQDIGDRVELSFLGGVAFNRVETEYDYDIDIRRLGIVPAMLDDVTNIEYSVGPAVGAEAAFKFGDSAAVTGGIRLHGIGTTGLSGWMIRPNVGMRWSF
jgi:opacity protein-like surface antigen